MSIFEIVTGPTASDDFTAKSFLEYFRKSSQHWWETSSANEDCIWVFRGQSNAAWPLVPVAARQYHQLPETFKAIVDLCAEEAQKAYEWPELSLAQQQMIVRRTAETLCVHRFEKVAFEVNFRSEMTLDKGARYPIADIVSAFAKRVEARHPLERAMDPLGFEPEENAYRSAGRLGCRNYEITALAQHHRVPTFFLDWSEDPLASLFFASSDSTVQEDIAVWALDAGAFEDLQLMSSVCLGLTIVRPTPSGNEFLAAQSGLFSYCARPEEIWEEQGSYPALDEHLNCFKKEQISEAFPDRSKEGVWIAEPILRKAVLRREHVSELRTLLYREGISLAHMMPTLDNVSVTSMDRVLSNLRSDS